MTELCQHEEDTLHHMGYVQASLEAQDRMNAGERQKRCKHCGLWIWERHWPPGSSLERTSKESPKVGMRRRKPKEGP